MSSTNGMIDKTRPQREELRPRVDSMLNRAQRHLGIYPNASASVLVRELRDMVDVLMREVEADDVELALRGYTPNPNPRARKPK